MSNLIAPHGGTLVNRIADAAEQSALQDKAAGLKQVELNERSLADIICIATGIYSPLEGFADEATYSSVVDNMRLPSGLAWSIPITFQVSEEVAADLSEGTDIALSADGTQLAIMSVTSIYRPDQDQEAQKLYKTTDDSHPGVAAVKAEGSVYVGGPITVIRELPTDNFPQYGFTPAQVRAEFETRGWSTAVAFQTRNPIHRAHEYLTKVALEGVDGLFINPLIGATQATDISAEVRMECYEVLMENYYPNDRVFLGTYPAAMRYAGPREAVLHAISRQNYGCSHFIVGRDHAGVGDYYGTYEAQEIFDNYSGEELAITPLKFEHCFFCKKCDSVMSFKTCPHTAEDRIFLSGTKVREMLVNGDLLPMEFSRPEVATILIEAYKS